MLKPLIRLHLSCASHAPAFFLMVVAAYFLAQLSIINPSIVAQIMLLLLGPSVFLSTSQRLPNKPWMVATLLLGTGVAILFPSIAHASIGTMMQSLRSDMTAWINTFVYVCYGGGVVSTAIGVSNGIKKSKGDQQVTTGSIFGYGLGGPALAMVGYIMNNAAESLGGSAGQMDRLPGGLF